DPRRILESGSLPDQRIDRVEEGRERLARSRRSGDERVPAGRDRRPAVPLRRGRLPEPGQEPLSNGGVEGIQGHPPEDTFLIAGVSRSPRTPPRSFTAPPSPTGTRESRPAARCRSSPC